MELKIQNITKRYRDKTAVDDVSITLTPGVWGPAGGERCRQNNLNADAGGHSAAQQWPDFVRWGGDWDAWCGLPGKAGAICRRNSGFDPEFTVQDYLEYMAALKGLPRTEAARQIDALLERVSLTEVRRKKIVKLSGGMKRRVGIAQALLNDPEFLNSR